MPLMHKAERILSRRSRIPQATCLLLALIWPLHAEATLEQRRNTPEIVTRYIVDVPARFTEERVSRLIGELEKIRTHCLTLETSFSRELEAVDPDCRPSARNLLHYLALRQQDLRDLQQELTSLGLSSLGGVEAHTLANIDAVLAALHRLCNRPMDRPTEAEPPVTFESGPELLRKNAAELLGEAPESRAVRIMVTMPTEAATDAQLVADLVRAGMDIMRINCAHDGIDAWSGMAYNLRRAEQETGRECKILMDLAGPKLRTGAIEPGRPVISWRPDRDDRGLVLKPVLVHLYDPNLTDITDEGGTWLPLEGGVIEAARKGDSIRLNDARGVRRILQVVSKDNDVCIAESSRATYIEQSSDVELLRGTKTIHRGIVGTLPVVEEPLRLKRGDTLILTGESQIGRPARKGPNGQIISPATVPCTLPEVFEQVKPGERVFFDDGKIAGVIKQCAPERLEIEITRARKEGSKLRSDKGINLPDTDLKLPALTSKDIEDIEFAVHHVNMVGFSFVRRPEDVLLLEEKLAERNGSHIGIVLKIENRTAFEALPKLLLVGMQSPPLGIMVARGDLAVEVGFERLAEVQEEMLWLCEAAHVPVIWATQVLESLAKKGMPSRAEVTDAAMSGRAECVMLNKGPHIVGAVKFLFDVLDRMHGHQHKKRSMMRELSVSKIRPWI